MDKFAFVLHELERGAIHGAAWAWALTPPPGAGLLYPCLLDWPGTAANDDQT